MKHQLETDILIVGGGPAGIQASRMLSDSDDNLKVFVVRPEDFSMVYCAIPYAIEGLIPLEKTFKKDALVTETGTELIRGSVESVNVDDHMVALNDGRKIAYKKLLITTGASPFRPPISGIDAANVFTVKTEADTRRILEQFDKRFGADGEKTQKAVVVGAGAIGIEQALAYRANGLEVHLIEMQDHLLPQMVDADMTGDITEKLIETGVQLHLETMLEALEGDDRISRVHLSGNKSIDLNPEIDFVIISVGMSPDIAFLDKAGFDRVNDGLVVDKHMKTSAQDVWAAGDCVSFNSGIDGAPLGGKLATNAVPMAKVAAGSMLGKDVSYPGFFNGAVTVVGNLRIGGTGFTENVARSRGMDVYTSNGATSARFPIMPDAGSIIVKLVIEKGSDRLVGAQVLGTEAVAERIDLLTFAMQRGATIADLSELSYSAQPWQTFFPARNAIVEASSKALMRR